MENIREQERNVKESQIYLTEDGKRKIKMIASYYLESIKSHHFERDEGCGIIIANDENGEVNIYGEIDRRRSIAYHGGAISEPEIRFLGIHRGIEEIVWEMSEELRNPLILGDEDPSKFYSYLDRFHAHVVREMYDQYDTVDNINRIVHELDERVMCYLDQQINKIF